MPKSPKLTVPDTRAARVPFRFLLPSDLVREARIQIATHEYRGKNQFMEEAVRKLVKSLKAAA